MDQLVRTSVAAQESVVAAQESVVAAITVASVAETLTPATAAGG
ncbi:hypothetical protein [Cryobacterium sp. TMT3-29-2]|nr:hypothetical protein [Cryobacterium sp. TMT3-29-2]